MNMNTKPESVTIKTDNAHSHQHGNSDVSSHTGMHGDETHTTIQQNVVDRNQFCVPGMHSVSGGVTMDMGGFRSIFLTPASHRPCLNFLFPSFTLSSPTKFFFAMVVSCILSFGTEALAAYRVKRKRRKSDSKSVRAQMYALHGLLGYVLMMIAMTYSLELLGCVVLGSGLGYAVFFCREEGEVVGDDGGAPELELELAATNACCAYLEEEEGDGGGKEYTAVSGQSKVN